jgi:hypothetical protein
VILFEPTASEEMDKVAVPNVRVPAPKRVAPSKKLTVPVAVPAPGETAATVAVKVTDCPKTEGLVEDVNAVVVVA